MTDKELLDYHILARKKYNLLKEVLDISKQMGACLDRNDQTSLRLLLASRQEPIETVEALEGEMEKYRKALGPKGELELKNVLKGEDVSGPQQEALRKQAIATGELLEEVISFDKRLSQRVNGA